MTVKTPSPPKTRAEKRSRAWYIALTVLLSLAVFGNMIFIFQMSAEGPEDSSNRSEGVSDVVVDVVYPDIDQRPPDEQVSIKDAVRHLVRKCAHFAEFALLGLLSAALLVHIARRAPRLRAWMQWVLPAVFCLLYAASDEWHQTFTGRGAAVKDVFIDFAGALCGLTVLHLGVFLVRRILRARAARKRAPKTLRKKGRRTA